MARKTGKSHPVGKTGEEVDERELTKEDERYIERAIKRTKKRKILYPSARVMPRK